MLNKLLLSILTVLTFTNLAFNGDLPELKVEVVINSDHGWPTRIVITGNSNQAKAWLGLSLYPYGVLDLVTGGRHSFIELKKGDIRHEIQVDTKMLGGSFEFALWGKKVDKVDCTLDYCYWCKMNGFHVDEQLAYKSGLLTRLSGYK